MPSINVNGDKIYHYRDDKGKILQSFYHDRGSIVIVDYEGYHDHPPGSKYRKTLSKIKELFNNSVLMLKELEDLKIGSGNAWAKDEYYKTLRLVTAMESAIKDAEYHGDYNDPTFLSEKAAEAARNNRVRRDYSKSGLWLPGDK